MPEFFDQYRKPEKEQKMEVSISNEWRTWAKSESVGNELDEWLRWLRRWYYT